MTQDGSLEIQDIMKNKNSKSIGKSKQILTTFLNKIIIIIIISCKLNNIHSIKLYSNNKKTSHENN